MRIIVSGHFYTDCSVVNNPESHFVGEMEQISHLYQGMVEIVSSSLLLIRNWQNNIEYNMSDSKLGYFVAGSERMPEEMQCGLEQYKIVNKKRLQTRLLYNQTFYQPKYDFARENGTLIAYPRYQHDYDPAPCQPEATDIILK